MFFSLDRFIWPVLYRPFVFLCIFFLRFNHCQSAFLRIIKNSFVF